MAVKPGDILQGRYRLDGLIGRGGMGEVFASTDLQTGAEVAVKVVSRLLVDDTIMVRLHREAEAAARIRSDYVPRVLEVSDTDERELFLVMERLYGEPLSVAIRTRGALPWSEVRHIAEDVLRGLIDAHTAGIVHRDLKPSNVFLAQRDGDRVRAFVLDFGVCKMDGLDHERLTGTGESIGTVAYMAPEQIRGAAKVDDRADLYAFGALVFEMLTGRLPHEGPSQMAILASKLEKPASRLADCVLVEIPEGLDALVAKTLARAPEDRFSSAQELLKAWRAVATGQIALTPSGALPDFPPTPRSAGGEPPTQVAGRGGAHAPIMVVGPPSAPRMQTAVMPRPASVPVPFEPFPTQTALTTAGFAAGQGRRSARLAVVLAACVMVVGLAVVGIAVARGPSATSAAAPAAEPTPVPMPLEPPPPAALDEAPADPPPSDTGEPPIVVDLEPEPEPEPIVADAGAPAHVTKRPASRGRSTPRPASRAQTPPAQSTQHITTQPRY